MKRHILPFIILTTLLTACGKKMCCVLPNIAYMVADKNNTQWSADPSSSNIRQDTIALFGTNFSTQLEETLTMQFKASAPGTYGLKGSQALYYNTIGRDVITSEYELDDTYANTVIITSYDKVGKVVTGTFNLKFNRVGSKGLFPLLSSHTTVRAVRHTAVCQNNGGCAPILA